MASPYYLGREAGAVYDFWKGHVCEFFNGGYLEFILHGSYSLGKTYVALIMLLRQLYEMSCFSNYAEAFGLSPSTKIKFAFVSVSASKARDSGIKKLIRM